MRVGLSLFGKTLNEDGARYAAQLGVHDVVLHLTDYGRNSDNSHYMAGGVGPINGECIQAPLWSYDDMSRFVSMLRRHDIRPAALENVSPNFWSDILLDGPEKIRQMEDMKRLVKDAGRAGIPVLGYNFSIAGVWGWQRKAVARGGAVTAVFNMAEIPADDPLPDGMVGNMRYRVALSNAVIAEVGEDELWQRVRWFLEHLVPVAEEAGVRLAAHPDDPPVDRLRRTPRLVNQPDKYDRLLDIVPSRANALEFCLGSLQEMETGNIYQATRHYARRDAIGYVHFRNVRGKVPHYEETFVDDGDIDMAEIVRILRDENYYGVLVPDHVPDFDCPAPWHAGNAYTVGYMKALVANARALGPSWSLEQAVA
jgi:mannonate dehydratase